MTAVGGDAGWTNGTRYPITVVKVLLGDSLNFTFTYPDNVFLMDNKVPVPNTLQGSV